MAGKKKTMDGGLITLTKNSINNVFKKVKFALLDKTLDPIKKQEKINAFQKFLITYNSSLQDPAIQKLASNIIKNAQKSIYKNTEGSLNNMQKKELQTYRNQLNEYSSFFDEEKIIQLFKLINGLTKLLYKLKLLGKDNLLKYITNIEEQKRLLDIALLQTFRNIDNSYDKLSKLLNKNELSKFIGNLEIKKKLLVNAIYKNNKQNFFNNTLGNKNREKIIAQLEEFIRKFFEISKTLEFKNLSNFNIPLISIIEILSNIHDQFTDNQK